MNNSIKYLLFIAFLPILFVTITSDITNVAHLQSIESNSVFAKNQANEGELQIESSVNLVDISKPKPKPIPIPFPVPDHNYEAGLIS